MDGNVPLGEALCWLVLLHARDARLVLLGSGVQVRIAATQWSWALANLHRSFRYSLILLSSFDIFNFQPMPLNQEHVTRWAALSDASWPPAFSSDFAEKDETWQARTGTRWLLQLQDAQGTPIGWKPMYHQQSRRNSLEHGEKQTCQYIWLFPKIVVPPNNHPFVHRVFHY